MISKLNLTELSKPDRDVLSAGAIPIRKNPKGQWECLLLRAFKYWDFPKGMVEEGEDPWSAALREVEEETGLSKFTTPCGPVFIETEKYGKGKTARYYILQIQEEKDIYFAPNPITGIIEHHEYRWVSLDEANGLVVPRIQKVLAWAMREIDKI